MDKKKVIGKISPHISYKEATRSDTAKRLGISNAPNEEHLVRMRLLAKKVFEPLRKHFNVPIYISSFFRSAALNKAIKGAKSSQHMKGEAMDIDADVYDGVMYSGITNKYIFDYIKDNLELDQLILEDVSKEGTGGWVHVSYKRTGNRNQVLTMTKINGKATYTT